MTLREQIEIIQENDKKYAKVKADKIFRVLSKKIIKAAQKGKSRIDYCLFPKIKNEKIRNYVAQNLSKHFEDEGLEVQMKNSWSKEEYYPNTVIVVIFKEPKYDT